MPSRAQSRPAGWFRQCHGRSGNRKLALGHRRYSRSPCPDLVVDRVVRRSESLAKRVEPVSRRMTPDACAGAGLPEALALRSDTAVRTSTRSYRLSGPQLLQSSKVPNPPKRPVATTATQVLVVPGGGIVPYAPCRVTSSEMSGRCIRSRSAACIADRISWSKLLSPQVRWAKLSSDRKPDHLDRNVVWAHSIRRRTNSGTVHRSA